MFGSSSSILTTLLLCLFHCALAVFVAITNAGFESVSDYVGCDNCYRYGDGIPSNWDLYDPNSIRQPTNLGVSKPKGGTTFDDPAFGDSVPEGNQCLYISIDKAHGGLGEVGIAQTLTGNIITVDTKYTLSVWVGDTATNTWSWLSQDGPITWTFDMSGFPGYRVQLLSHDITLDEDVILAEDDNELSITESHWKQSTVSVTISSDDPNIGKTLKIRLINKNAVPVSGPLDFYDVNFDYVQLQVEPVIYTSDPTVSPETKSSTFYPTFYPTVYPQSDHETTMKEYTSSNPTMYPTLYPIQQETTTTSIEEIPTNIENPITTSNEKATTTTIVEEATTTIEDPIIIIEATTNIEEKSTSNIYHETTTIIDIDEEKVTPSSESIDGRSMGIGIAVALVAMCIVGGMALLIFNSKQSNDTDVEQVYSEKEEPLQVFEDDEKEMTLGARIADIGSDADQSDSSDGVYGTRGCDVKDKKKDKVHIPGSFKDEKADVGDVKGNDTDPSISDGMYVKPINIEPGTPACSVGIRNDSLEDSDFDKLDMWQNGKGNEGEEGQRVKDDYDIRTVEGDSNDDDDDDDFDCEHITIGGPTQGKESAGDASGME